MRTHAKKQIRGTVACNDRPAAVVLDIEVYREMVERLEHADDLKALEKMRQRPLKFRRLEDFLKEYSPRV